MHVTTLLPLSMSLASVSPLAYEKIPLVLFLHTAQYLLFSTHASQNQRPQLFLSCALDLSLSYF